MSEQNADLARNSEAEAERIAEAFSAYTGLVRCRDRGVRQVGVNGLNALIADFAVLVYRWHLTAGALLPAQAALLKNMSSAKRISAAEVSRRLPRSRRI